ncbi:MAG: histidine phosphatase family protein [Candidatus Staskawiczbacteria bacterium]|nr:histidine phosphatase family protein [Candidatus Staskawiczbacteria bacterium]MBI3337517.1 histidine phosphatase family protein [Candidatus Staskawiczbacteria bacterium]
MAKLILLRHLKSQWNEDNEFAGWVDNPLSKEGILAAKEVADKLATEKIDVVYTSPLIRNEETILRIFEQFPNKYPLFLHLDGGKMQKWGNYTDLNQNDVPVYVSENLNERYYGKLQGLNKEEIIKQYSYKTVQLWRRGFNSKPPEGESLKNVYDRAVPFYKKYVEKDLKQGKNVLLVASHNSLRALIKYIEEIADQDIVNVELPFGALLEYEFNNDISLRSKKYFSTVA